MKNHSYISIFMGLVFCCLFLPAGISYAGVTLPWSTTFNCNEWTQSNGLTASAVNCDSLSAHGGWTADNGDGTKKEEQITQSANNTNGGGGRGQRHWVGDGTTNGSGGLGINFATPYPELWIRWYMRYELDFQWDASTTLTNQVGQKWLYIDPGATQYVHVDMSNFDTLQIGTTSSGYWSSSGTGWNTVMANGATDVRGNKKSDGLWHRYEAHLKMDTNGSNGVIEIWIDGILRMSNQNVNYKTQSGWSYIVIGSNAVGSVNGRAMYLDYDDISIGTTGFVGTSYDTTPPSAPPTTPTVKQP